MRRKLLLQGLLVAAVALAASGMARAADEADYVGQKTCKMCHSKQHAAWAATKHAKALELLKAADDKKVAEMAAKMKVEAKKATDDACVGCHVTGLGTKSGFVATDSMKVVLLGAVTCESCHGPGSKHKAAAKDQKKATIIGHPDKESCTKCHTEAVSPKFDFDAMKAKVHPVAAAMYGGGWGWRWWGFRRAPRLERARAPPPIREERGWEWAGLNVRLDEQ